MEYASNPKAGFDYEILETIEAGLVLLGHEVRSIRTGRASIKGAYVKILNLPAGKAGGQAAYLVGAVIAPYQPGNLAPGYDPQASRKLLLTKKQLATLVGLSQSHGLTLVPLKLYDKKGHIKLLIGVAKGKKKYDKRESLKKKDIARAKQRGIED